MEKKTKKKSGYRRFTECSKVTFFESISGKESNKTVYEHPEEFLHILKKKNKKTKHDYKRFRMQADSAKK